MKSSTPSTSSNSVAPAYLLMAGILAFGLGSAFMVLRSDAPEATEPARVSQAPAPVASAPSLPAEAVAAPASAVAPSPVQAPAPAPAPEPEPPARKDAVDAKPSKPAPKQSAPARKVSPAPAKDDTETAVIERPRVSRPKAPAGDNQSLGAERDIPKAEAPKAEAPSTERPAKADKAEGASKAEGATRAPEAEPRPVIKPLTAPALVPIPAEPKVVAATEDRAYVRLDDKRTVIVKKGEPVQGLGAYLGLDGVKAKFESGTLPITTH